MNSNYLSFVRKEYNIKEVCTKIRNDIEQMKKECKLIKRDMEK
jgi:hypothetical protein